jgi:hypothetical protein
MGVDDAALSAVIDVTGLSTIQVAGSATLQGDMVVDLDDFVPQIGDQYMVLSAQGGISGSLQLAGPAANSFILTTSGNDLLLTYVAPEPSTLLILGSLGSFLLMKRCATSRR